MDANHNTQVWELFKHRRTVLVLDCLYTDGPMRWTDIRQAMSRRIGTSVGDQTVTRPLKVLQRLGLVAKDGKRGNRLYTLTPLGTERFHQLQDLYTQLDQYQDEQGEAPG